MFARDLATGSDKVVWDKVVGDNFDIRVSHDGARLAIRGGPHLVVVDLASGQAREIHRIPEATSGRFWALEWSADDRQLLTIVKPGIGLERMEFWVFPAEGGEPNRLPIPKEFRGLALSPDGKYLATTRVTQRNQLWALENFLPAK